MQTGTRPVGKYCIPWQLKNVPGTDFGDLVSNHVPMASIVLYCIVLYCIVLFGLVHIR